MSKKHLVLMAVVLLLCLLPLAHLSGLLRVLSGIVLLGVLATRPQLPTAFLGSVFVFFMVLIFSALSSAAWIDSMKALFWNVVVVLACFAYIQTSENSILRWQLPAFLGSVGLLVFFTLGAGYAWSLTGIQGGSAIGFWKYYPGPGIASTMLILSMPLLWGTVLTQRKSVRIYGGLLLLGLSWAGWLTGNRQFWIEWALMMFWGGYELTTVYSRWKPVFFTALWSAAAFMLYSIVYHTHERTHLSMHVAAHDDLRPIIWGYWYNYFRLSPWIGNGFGKHAQHAAYLAHHFSSVAGNAVDPVIYTHGHNVVLNMLVQTGLVGTVAWFGVLIQLIRWAYTIQSETGGLNYYAKAVLPLVCVMLLKNMSDDFMDFECTLYFWSEAALLLALAQRIQRSHEPKLNSPQLC